MRLVVQAQPGMGEARRPGVPLHTVGRLSASKLPDGQSQQEATWGLMMAMFAGANVINHATGWLEGGLVTSFEKPMIDHDRRDRAGAAFPRVGAHPGRFSSALFRPLTRDDTSFEQ